MKKITIECSEKEANLIERALELYGRIGMLQFDRMTLCDSLQQLVWTSDLAGEFQIKTDELKAVFGYARNANPGIHNKEIVSDDVRESMHMYQQMRHERYLDRVKSGEQSKEYSGVDQSPADICHVAGIKSPNFKIKIE